MFNWLQQPLHIRLAILDMYKGPNGSSAVSLINAGGGGPMMGVGGGGGNGGGGGGNVAPPPPPPPPPPQAAPNARPGPVMRTRGASTGLGDENGGSGNHPKRPRLVFTDIQKRTLQVIQDGSMLDNHSPTHPNFRPSSKRPSARVVKCSRPSPSISVSTCPQCRTSS